MTAALRHRGPDDEGIYVNNASYAHVGLGHRRLRIIDLSKRGRQPLWNEDHTICMVFNGEIFNFQNLRSELESRGHRFFSNTDCETVIHLYEEEGVDGFRNLIGMYAFAIWDERKSLLVLCRDRVGIKPILYFEDSSSLIFSSEIKSILQDPDFTKVIDWNSVDLYFSLNYIPHPHTIFKGLKKLEPGHTLTYCNGKTETYRYWNLEEGITLENNVNSQYVPEIKTRLYSTLEEAVKIRMVADVPVGAFLSGGIDSSIIVGLMARNSAKPVKTYSIGYTDMPLFDETHYARDVAVFNRTDHHEIKLSAQSMINSIPDILDVLDEPFADSSVIPAFIVSRETARNVKVALTGDGGDELFAGYRMYQGESIYERYRKIPLVIRKNILEPLGRMLPDSRYRLYLEYLRRVKKFLQGAGKDNFEERFFAWNEIFSRDIRMSLLEHQVDDHDSAENIFADALKEKNFDKVNRMLYADFKVSLPGDMLRKVDATSMSHSLEARVPMLDHRFCELAFSLEGALKLRHGQGKYILIETFRDIIPKSLYHRPKWGFEVPIGQWLKRELRHLVDEYLDEGRLASQGLFQPEVVSSLKRSFMDGTTDLSWHMWNLIVFQYWYERYCCNS